MRMALRVVSIFALVCLVLLGLLLARVWFGFGGSLYTTAWAAAVLLLPLVFGFYIVAMLSASVRGVVAALDRRQWGWLAALVVALAVSAGGVVELVARESTDSVAAQSALVVMTLLTFPIAPLASLIYSVFVKSLVATPTERALRRQEEAALNFREQVTVALSPQTRGDLQIAFSEHPLSALFVVDGRHHGWFAPHQPTTATGGRPAWEVHFPDGRRQVIPAGERTFLQAIDQWRRSLPAAS